MFIIEESQVLTDKTLDGCSVIDGNVYNDLYYKNRIIWKTFVTQFGPALPLTPDPPVI
jgi:hypothetical protein